MKIRIGLLIKNLGLWPIYGIGALFCVGLLSGGAYAIDQKDFIKQQINNVADITKNAQTDLTTVNDNIETAFNSAESADSQIKTTIDNLKTLKQKLDEINNNNSANQDSNTKEEITKISNDIDKVISALENVEIPNRDSLSGIEELIGPNGTVTSILSNVNNWLDNNNNDSSPLWTYYDLISKILLSVGSVLIGLFILGFILLIIFNKRVDGFWVSRKNIKKDLALHIKKLMKKYPELSKHLMQKYVI